jgi:hypothetical protein
MSGINEHLHTTGLRLRDRPELVEHLEAQHRALYNPFLQPGGVVITAIRLLPRGERSAYAEGAEITRFDALVKYVARDTVGDPESDGRSTALIRLAEEISSLAAAEYNPRTLPVYDLAAILDDPFFLVADAAL